MAERRLGRQLSVPIDDELAERLERAAANDRRTLAGFVRVLLARGLEEQPAQHEVRA